jgi:hypothetical protein
VVVAKNGESARPLFTFADESPAELSAAPTVTWGEPISGPLEPRLLLSRKNPMQTTIKSATPNINKAVFRREDRLMRRNLVVPRERWGAFDVRACLNRDLLINRLVAYGLPNKRYDCADARAETRAVTSGGFS